MEVLAYTKNRFLGKNNELRTVVVKVFLKRALLHLTKGTRNKDKYFARIEVRFSSSIFPADILHCV